MIKSISQNHDELLLSIMQLYGIEAFTLDPTYSEGVFYRGDVPEPVIKGDIAPEGDVIEVDSRNTGLYNETISSIIFDPPFLATKGPSLSQGEGNITANRFTVYDDEKKLHKMYYDSLIEFYRILKPQGFLVFKCQDKVSSGKQYFSHIYIHNWAHSIGFYPRDLFVYEHKTRVLSGKHTAQQHARKYHAYFFVFQKIRPKVNYHELIK